jgi:cytochrome c oxidase subunit 3
MFVGSQAWEWSNFINGTYSAVRLDDGRIIQFVDDSKTDGHGKKAMVSVSDFAIHTSSERVQHESKNGLWFVSEGTLPEYTIPEIMEGFKANPNLRVKSPLLDMEIKQKVVLDRKESLAYLEKANREVSGANMVANEYGNNLFANFFFFITGFHGFHVVSGIIINIIIFFNVVLGTYQRRGHYEMVEKVGLYWHFVDLVWVFVFTFFYLV